VADADDIAPGAASLDVGSVVRLASGGPKMTIERVAGASSGDQGVHCAWFVAEVLRRDVFPAGAVVPANAAPAAPGGKAK